MEKGVFTKWIWVGYLNFGKLFTHTIWENLNGIGSY